MKQLRDTMVECLPCLDPEFETLILLHRFQILMHQLPITGTARQVPAGCDHMLSLDGGYQALRWDSFDRLECLRNVSIVVHASLRSAESV